MEMKTSNYQQGYPNAEQQKGQAQEEQAQQTQAVQSEQPTQVAQQTAAAEGTQTATTGAQQKQVRGWMASKRAAATSRKEAFATPQTETAAATNPAESNTGTTTETPTPSTGTTTATTPAAATTTAVTPANADPQTTGETATGDGTTATVEKPKRQLFNYGKIKATQPEVHVDELEPGKQYMFGKGDGGYKKYTYLESANDGRVLVQDEGGNRYYLDKTYSIYNEGAEPRDLAAEMGVVEGEADYGTNGVPSYADLFEDKNPNPQLSKEQQKKMQRRERAQRVIAGLGDIGANIANIVTTAKGATPWTVEPKNSLSGVYADKWDQWRKDYDTRVKDWRTAYNNAMRTDSTYNIKSRANQLRERQQQITAIKNAAMIEHNKAIEQLKKLEIDRRAAMDEATRNKIDAEITRTKQQTLLYKNMTEHPEKYHPVHQTTFNYSGEKGYTYKGKKYNSALEAWQHVAADVKQKAIRKYGTQTGLDDDEAIEYVLDKPNVIVTLLGWIERNEL